MSQTKISVIIPIYNTAEYLPVCIESIIGQTYKDIEIILVDDGSTDDSLKVCEYYAKKDSRIRIVRQTNQGNNAARKAGVQESVGQYITFVDSDDWIGSELLALLYGQIEKNDVDLVVSDVLMTKIDGTGVERRNLIVSGIYENPRETVKKLFYYYEDCIYGIMPFIFAKLYKRELLIKAMEMVDDRIQYDEDRALVWTCLMQNIKVMFIDSIAYYYCQREDGLVRSQDELYLAKINYFYYYMRRLFEKEDLILKKQLENYILASVKTAFRWKLGLSQNNLIKSKYVLDSSVFLDEPKKVILYGAGAVGRDYYSLLQESCNIRLCAWIDQKWAQCQGEGLAVQPLETILLIEYDYILVAVKNRTVFMEIKKQLESLDISAEKVIWGKPYEIQVH